MGVWMMQVVSNRFIGFSAKETVETVKGENEITGFPHDDPARAEWG
jgi:hypothetical protein